MGKSVFAFRVRGGYIFNECFKQIMPSERFYLGGAFSLRGYGSDLVPPLSAIMCGDKKELVPIGGKAMFNGTLELRCPLYKSLYGVVFFDYGALSQDVIATLYSKLPVAAAGIGLRYHTVVGPIRFDWGWKLDDNISYKRSAWFLTFGQIF